MPKKHRKGGRTHTQTSRLKLETFHRACQNYARKLRPTPPRLRLSLTLPIWENVCRRHGVHPDDVFVDAIQWPKAVQAAKGLEEFTTVEEELERLWKQHKERIYYRNTRRKEEMQKAMLAGDFDRMDRLREEDDAMAYMKNGDLRVQVEEGGQERLQAAKDTAAIERAVQTLLTKGGSKEGNPPKEE